MIQWTEKSRFGGLRTYIYDAEKSEIHIHCDDVLCVSYSSGQRRDEIVSVDPDGGPCIRVGGRIIQSHSDTFKVLCILSEKFSYKQERLDIVLSVVKEEKDRT